MLEEPELVVDALASRLQTDYRLRVQRLDFLPLGADPDTAVYRAVAAGSSHYFLKLRRGPFEELSLRFPVWLQTQGVERILAPVATVAGRLYTTLREFRVVLYPFVEGCNGYEHALSEPQWVSFGATLRRLHASEVPADLWRSFPRETFSADARATVRRYLARLGRGRFAEPVAQEAAALLLSRRALLAGLVDRADALARALRGQTPSLVACHGDLHAGNLHLAAGDAFYLVDWDTLTLAPKERDLMFVGGGLLGGHLDPGTEEAWFYRGYGATEVNRAALAYYRHERIVQDVAVYCELLLGGEAGGEDRRQALEYLEANFRPGGTIELARRTDALR